MYRRPPPRIATRGTTSPDAIERCRAEICKVANHKVSGIPANERYLLESLAVIPVDFSAVPTLSWAMTNFSREELAMNWQR